MQVERLAALVGLVGAVFGSVPMTLVLMITGGQTKRPIVLFLLGAMLLGTSCFPSARISGPRGADESRGVRGR